MWVYILQSSKTHKYYIGYTANLVKRLEQHNNGLTQSTKVGIPWRMIYTEEYDTKSKAILREKQIKSYKGAMLLNN